MTTISIRAFRKKSPHRLQIQNHFRKSSGVPIATMTLHSSLIYIINLYLYFNSKTYEGCSKSFANRYTENTQSIGI